MSASLQALTRDNFVVVPWVAAANTGRKTGEASIALANMVQVNYVSELFLGCMQLVEGNGTKALLFSLFIPVKPSKVT